ncbi:MAG: tetratricopeptide repeat protein [Planctomycetota bacterium]
MTRPSTPNDRGTRAAILLAVLTAIPFLFGLDGDFVGDDRTLVASNALVQDPSRFGELVLGGSWRDLSPELAADGSWRPVTSLVLALLWHVGGGEAFAFKLASLLVHLAAVLGAFRLARGLARRTDVAFLAALLFGVHPLGVEAVGRIGAIADPLALAFGLHGAASFVRARSGGSSRAPAVGLVLLGLALLSKESAVAFLPAALVAAALAPRDGAGTSPTGGERVPLRHSPAFALVVLAGAWFLARALVLGSWHGGLLADGTDFHVSFARMLALRVEFVGGALWRAIWPADLALLRGVRPALGFGDLEVLVPLLVVAAFVALGLVLRSRGPRAALAAFGWSALALALPAIAIDRLGQFPFADRFAYPALPGLALLAALALLGAPSRLRTATTVAAGAIVLLLALRSANRTDVWHDERAYWDTALRESPDVAYVLWNVGRLELDEFRETPTRPKVTSAIEHFQAALDLGAAEKDREAPTVVMSSDVERSNLGLAWALLFEAQVDGYGDLDTPISVFELIVQNQPRNADAWRGLGVARAQKGDFDRAAESFAMALSIRPDDPDALFHLGLLKFKTADFREARARLDRAAELRPNDAEYLLWAARAAAETDDRERARTLAQRCVELDAASAEPLVLLGNLARREGDFAAALGHLDAATRIAPKDPNVLFEHGLALLGAGRRDDALFELVEAARLGDDRYDAQLAVAQLLLQDDVPVEDVLPYLRRAYELCPNPAVLGQLRAKLDELLPPTSPVRSGLAVLDEKRGDLETALYWAEGGANGPDEKGVGAYVFGRMLLKSGSAGAALPWLETAVERGGADYGKLRELGEARVLTGDADGAIEAWRRAIDALPEAARADENSHAMLRAAVARRDRTDGARRAPPQGPSPATDGSGAAEGSR